MENKMCNIRKNRFEYYMNAVHYCIYKEEVWSNAVCLKIVMKCIFFVSELFNLKEWYYRRDENIRKDTKGQNYMFGKESGLSIGMAHHWFGFFYSGYFGFLSFILLGIYFRFCGELNQIYFWLLIAVPIGLGYIPAYMAIYPNDKYLRYFKLFEKKDEHWHRKWKRITIVFCIGSVAAVLFGILAAWGILLLWR